MGCRVKLQTCRTETVKVVDMLGNMDMVGWRSVEAVVDCAQTDDGFARRIPCERVVVGNLEAMEVAVEAGALSRSIQIVVHGIAPLAVQHSYAVRAVVVGGSHQDFEPQADFVRSRHDHFDVMIVFSC
jgi:hypothetical protein